MQIGQRKFTSVGGTTILVLGLSFWGLMAGKLAGTEFVSAIYASCVLVAGYCGFNVTNSFLQNRNDK